MRHSPPVRSQGRRRVLQWLGIAIGGSSLASVATASDGQQSAYVLEQADQHIPLVPLPGTDTAEEFYQYAYPHDQFDSISGIDGTTFSSEGTTDLQRDRTSILFLYDGPDGLSLVIVHGRLDGDTDAGGTVSFQIHGLPTDGEWVVRDDYYLDEDGTQSPTNYDRWDVDGEVHTIDWAYQGGRTDGGVFQGLGDDFVIRIEPAFNDAAALAEDHDFGPIENWEVLSGDRDDPERHSIDLDRPLVLRPGDITPLEGDESTKDDRKTDDKAKTEKKEREEKEEKKEKKGKRGKERGKKKGKQGKERGKKKGKQGKERGKKKGKQGKERGKKKGKRGKGRGKKNGKGK